MTYKELLNQLSQLNEEQLNQDVAIWNSDYEIDEVYGSYRIDEYDGFEREMTAPDYDWVTP